MSSYAQAVMLTFPPRELSPLERKLVHEWLALAGDIWRLLRDEQSRHGRQLRPRSGCISGHAASVTFDTCEVITDRWTNWMRHDPVVAVETLGNNLRSLKALNIDCGERDQFNLLFGARRFVRRLNELGIVHRYEEFAGNHSGVDYRMDESLPFLAAALEG
jgi:hypothetical protein